VPSVIATIIARSRREPNFPAVKDDKKALTYAELLAEVARHAAGLSRRGVVSGDRVGILVPNSVDFVVAALACLWLGAVFVPLAPTDPEARLASIVADCDPRLVVVTDASLAPAELTPGGVVKIPLAALREDRSDPTPATEISPRLSYIIYTSGTTGTPKGVLIGDVAFAAALRATVDALGLNQSTRTLCVSPFHFDGSFGTLFATLFAGGAVVIRPREELLFPRAFFNTVANERITYTGFSPSYLRLLLSSPQAFRLGNSSLEVIALGGEVSVAADVLALWANAPALRVFNRYGPTETTIAVTHARLTPEAVAQGTVPIGRPHPDVSFYLLDVADFVIEEPNQVGELHVGGVQLMEGYWGDEKLSAQVLRGGIVPGEVVYRTGDLVYRDSSGEYVYVDRTDRVVKRSGVRISLVELGESIRRLPRVAAAVCVMFDDQDEPGIVAFVVAEGDVAAVDLVSGLKELIPDSMLPNRVEFVSTLPMTGAGKLDERRLLHDVGLRPPRAGGRPG
jgi:D-alanine--poly(phosphoribitol) ligase subunit 1